MKVISTEQKPIKMWLDDIEDGALEQARNLANLPFLYKHVALMPDCHQGYGMPIGGVIATDGVIIPNAVGVDIGCGMCAIKTRITNIATPHLKELMGQIRSVIPLGFEHHKEPQDEKLMPAMPVDLKDSIVNRQYQSALKQLGTLGGGNHFIEFQKDTKGFIWVMIHSGSRNLGKMVADHYNKIAKKFNAKWFSSVPKEYDLSFLPIETQEAKDYMTEMQYCVDFALANRKLMMEKIMETIRAWLWRSGPLAPIFEPIINIAHNYAAWENHFGKNVIVHRKGATLARENTTGIIPGSQGTKSYIVKGKGNPESFMSCSHGAGRKMGRNVACKTLNLADEIKRLDDQGIIHGIRHEKDLDEAAGAYKDIDVVMNNQKDLVEIVEELTPIAVIKG